MEKNKNTKNCKRIIFFSIALIFSIFIFSSSIYANTQSPQISQGNFLISSTGNQIITGVGFEPDLIKFEITSTNENFNTQTLYPGRKFGWGHGFANVKNSTIDQIALSVASGSASTNGMAAASTNSYSIFQVITPSDGDGISGFIESEVISTNSDGFTINTITADDSQYVTYTAYKFEDNAKIDVGFFNTSTITGLDSIDIGFEPNFLNIITQPHQALNNINTQVHDPDGDNGWGHGFASQRRGTIEQFSMAVSMHSENIDYHSWGSSDQHILYALEMKPKTGTITGRIKASLESFDNNGFTLNYDEVATGQIAIYMAVDTKFESKIGYFQTPTTSSNQIINTDIQLDSISFIGSNTVESINSEEFVLANHHGWMFGSGDLTNQQSIGFSSSSNSVNAHSSGSSSSQGINLLYTDQNGNVLGKDSANLIDIGIDNFELSWNNIVTSSTAAVNYDSVLMGYYGFASTLNFPPRNEQVNFTNNQISINDSNLINATITDKNGNSTISNVNTTISGPNSTIYNINLTPEIISDFISTGNIENQTQNYTAINDGDTIGESGEIQLQNRETKLVEFTQIYNQTPVIIAIASSQNNDNSPFIPVIYSINKTHANISLCRDNGASTCDNSYTAETVHYMIFDIDKSNKYSWIDVGRFNQTTNGATSTISFGKTFSNTPYVFGSAQSYNINSIVTNGIGAMSWFPSTTTTQTGAIACDHPGSANNCAGTAIEEFGYVAIDRVEQNLTDFSAGTQTISASTWTNITYGKSFENPIISVNVNSENGGEDPKYPWARNVGTNGADIRYCEADGANDCDTHNGEVTRWMALEKGPIRIGAGGQDIEKNLTIKTYNNVFLQDTFNITNLLFEVDVTQYNNSASQAKGNNNPDLKLEVNSNSTWESIGLLNINSTGTYSINVTNSSILDSWNTISNRDLRIVGVNFDHFDESTKDIIFYDSLRIFVDYEKYSSSWFYNFTNTLTCGYYNLTQITSIDDLGEINQTLYSNKNFLIPCEPQIKLIYPVNNTKILTDNLVNFTWEFEYTSSNLTCDLYINSIFNQSTNCDPGINNSLLVKLGSGYYNWTINVTTQDNITGSVDEENFYNILNVNSQINKKITNIGTNISFVEINYQNKINASRDLKIIDFVDSTFNAGSFNPLYTWFYNIFGDFIGRIFGFEITTNSLTFGEINYSINQINKSSNMANNYKIALD